LKICPSYGGRSAYLPCVARSIRVAWKSPLPINGHFWL
jgi:hypothetical protein